MTGSLLVTTIEGATAANVEPATVRDWRRKGWLTRVGLTKTNRPLYDLAEILKVERSTRDKGRLRNSQVVARLVDEIPWELDAVNIFVIRAASVLGNRKAARGQIVTAFARLSFQGDPPGTAIPDLRVWLGAMSDEQLGRKIVEVCATQIAEQQARAIHARRRSPNEGDQQRQAYSA